MRPPIVSPRQLALSLQKAPSFAADDFLDSPSNAAAHRAVTAWPTWTDRTLLVVGPAGSGKSHLAAIWAERAGATRLRRDWQPGDGRCAPILLLDDADLVRPPDAAMFHALNHVNEAGGWMLVTASIPPDAWGIATPDLLSRLRRAPIHRLGEPDETLLRAVIVKIFADQQILVEEDVVNFVARHCERSLASVRRFVSNIDSAALEGRRRITRALASAVLERLSDEDEDNAAEAAADQGPT